MNKSVLKLKKKYYFSIAFGVMLFLIVSCSSISTQITDEHIDVFGESLAKWGHEHGVKITINGLPINEDGPNAGGASPVYYKSSYFSKNETKVFHNNLKTLLEKSNCDRLALKNYLSSNFVENSQDKLLEEIKCLGEVKFISVEWSVD